MRPTADSPDGKWGSGSFKVQSPGQRQVVLSLDGTGASLAGAWAPQV